MNKFFLTALIGCWGTGCVADDQALTLDELMPMFGWDFEATEIRSEKVGDGLFVLFGVGGNIAVSVGSDGVMIVDDQFPEMTRLRPLGKHGTPAARVRRLTTR